MKTTIAALLMLAVLTGCGDSNYYTADTGTVITEPPPADPPPTIAADAAFIPANTYCTAKMNFVLSVEGVPTSIGITDGPNSHNHYWIYETTEYRAGYYFRFADTGYYSYMETCDFDFYKTYTIIP